MNYLRNTILLLLWQAVVCISELICVCTGIALCVSRWRTHELATVAQFPTVSNTWGDEPTFFRVAFCVSWRNMPFSREWCDQRGLCVSWLLLRCFTVGTFPHFCFTALWESISHNKRKQKLQERNFADSLQALQIYCRPCRFIAGLSDLLQALQIYCRPCRFIAFHSVAEQGVTSLVPEAKHRCSILHGICPDCVHDPMARWPLNTQSSSENLSDSHRWKYCNLWVPV